jgi:hypothetical protein
MKNEAKHIGGCSLCNALRSSETEVAEVKRQHLIDLPLTFWSQGKIKFNKNIDLTG